MATNFIQPGDVLTLTAPYAVASGAGLLVGSLFGVATRAADNGAAVEASTRGVYELPKLSTDVVAIGDKLYWDNTNKRLTKTSTDNTLVATAVSAAGNGVATVYARLNGFIG